MSLSEKPKMQNKIETPKLVTARTLRNILGVMRSLEFGDVSENVLPLEEWRRFSSDPFARFAKLSDEQQDAIAECIHHRLVFLSSIAAKLS